MPHATMANGEVRIMSGAVTILGGRISISSTYSVADTLVANRWGG